MTNDQSRKQEATEPRQQWGFGDFVTRYVGPALLIGGVPAIAERIGSTNVFVLGIVCVLVSMAWAGYVWWARRESPVYPNLEDYRFRPSTRWTSLVWLSASVVVLCVGVANIAKGSRSPRIPLRVVNDSPGEIRIAKQATFVIAKPVRTREEEDRQQGLALLSYSSDREAGEWLQVASGKDLLVQAELRATSSFSTLLEEDKTAVRVVVRDADGNEYRTEEIVVESRGKPGQPIRVTLHKRPILNRLSLFRRQGGPDGRGTPLKIPLVEDAQAKRSSIPCQLGPKDDILLEGEFSHATCWYVVWIDSKGEVAMASWSRKATKRLRYPENDQEVVTVHPKGVHFILVLAYAGSQQFDESTVCSWFGKLGPPPASLLDRNGLILKLPRRSPGEGIPQPTEFTVKVTQAIPQEIDYAFGAWVEAVDD